MFAHDIDVQGQQLSRLTQELIHPEVIGGKGLVWRYPHIAFCAWTVLYTASMADTYSSLYDSPAVKMHNHDSEPPTRASTPSLVSHSPNLETVGDNGDVKEITAEMNQGASPGVLPEDVYDTALSWWRAWIRRLLVRNLKRESAWLGAMQASCILIGLSLWMLRS